MLIGVFSASPACSHILNVHLRDLQKRHQNCQIHRRLSDVEDHQEVTGSCAPHASGGKGSTVDAVEEEEARGCNQRGSSGRGQRCAATGDEIGDETDQHETRKDKDGSGAG